MIEQLSSPGTIHEAASQYHDRRSYRKAGAPSIPTPVPMRENELRRYVQPSEDTAFPLEYAFHLLGSLEGKTIVDLGCGDGTNTVILASLGARVLSVDYSSVNLELTGSRAAANRVAARVTLLNSDASGIPIRENIADHVLCTSAFHHLNPILIGRQIRRILRPGGTAVFKEPLAVPSLLQTVKVFLPDAEIASPIHHRLTLDEIEAVSRAVGKPGRSRGFWVTTRLLLRMGFGPSALTKVSQKFDTSLLCRFPSSLRFASPLVWEARKES